MDAVVAWCMDHQALIGIGASVVCLLIPNTVFVKAGIVVSAFIRRVAGKGVEEKIERAAESFVKGMEGDNGSEKKDSQ